MSITAAGVEWEYDGARLVSDDISPFRWTVTAKNNMESLVKDHENNVVIGKVQPDNPNHDHYYLTVNPIYLTELGKHHFHDILPAHHQMQFSEATR